jgi:hypothetical protein
MQSTRQVGSDPEDKSLNKDSTNSGGTGPRPDDTHEFQIPRSNSVYDKDNGSQPLTGPDLRSQELGTQSDSFPGNRDSPQSTQSEPSQGPSTSSSGNGGVGRAGLRGKEGQSGDRFPGNQEGQQGPNLGTKSGRFKFGSSYVMKHRKNFALLGGGGGIIIAGIIGAFFALLPLKTEQMVQNVENHFFASSENAVGDETDTMMKDWIKGPLAQALINNKGHCSTEGHTVISKDCTLNFNSGNTNPVYSLYKTWAQAKLEDKLADDYGIELKYDAAGSGTFYLKAPGIGGDGEEKVGTGIEGIGSDFVEVDRGTVRQAFRDAEKDMTGWDKVMFRYKVGRLLEEKYGIKRCIIYCGQRDALANKSADEKYAAKMFLIERVIEPDDAALAAVMKCVFETSADACSATESTTTCAEDEEDCAEEAGAPQTDADAEVEGAVGEATSDFGSETAAKLIKNISDIRDAGGFQNYVLDQIISQVFGDDVAEDAVPVVGQIEMLYTASVFIKTITNAPVLLQKMDYLTNAEAAVSMYSMWRTYSDEIHTNHVNAAEVGSFNSALSSGSQCVASLEGTCNAADQVGGTADATQTPLYAYMNDQGESSTTTATATSLLSAIDPSADAASSTTDPSYTCANGKPVPAGQLVCSEEKLGQTSTALTDVSTYLKDSGLSGLASVITDSMKGGLLNPIHDFFALYNTVASTLTSGIEKIFEVVPGVSSLENLMQSKASEFFTFVTSKLVVSPFAEDMSGGRSYDMIVAGGDAAGSDYAHTGLGGKQLTNQQAADQVSAFDSQLETQESKQPLFARLFSTSDPYSLLSKVATDMPFSLSSTGYSFAASIASPFKTISSDFSSILSGKASAATPAIADPFGITQYGYTQADLDAIGNPETYWDNHCSDNASQAYQNDTAASNPSSNWNDEAAVYDITAPNNNDPSGEPINTTTNPCMLIEGTVGSAGGELNSSLLTSDDTADISGASSSTSTSSNCVNTTSSAASASFFYTNGKYICDNNNDQFIPYGVSNIDDLDQYGWNTPQFAAASDAQIHAAADYWSVNSIRIQVSEKNFMTNPTNGQTYNVPAMQRLQTELNEILSLGKIPILSDNTERTNPDQYYPTAETVAFWKAVTGYLSSQNNSSYGRVIFDVFNEPRNIGWAQWQSSMQGAINAIRNSGNSLHNNLIFAQGPYLASTLNSINQYQLSGGNIVYDYHHVDFTTPTSQWEAQAGISLNLNVPIVDGEWAQYESNRSECYPNAPADVSNYLNTLQQSGVGLIFWTLEPGVGTTKLTNPEPVSDSLTSWFPTTESGYETPDSFSSVYDCKKGGLTSPLVGEGAGSDVLDYFQQNNDYTETAQSYDE